MAKIYIIDDQASVRATIRTLLEKAGHSVAEASNGRLALASLTRDFDLIITDILMPEMDGLEVIRSIRRLQWNIPIIVITGGLRDSKIDLLSYASNFGADYTLSKSSLLTDLVPKVESVLTATAH